MEITICSPDKQNLEVIIDCFESKGFEFGDIYSKKKYWLFGSVTWCADLESITTANTFAKGGVSHYDGSEFIPPVYIHKGNIDLNSMPGFLDAINSIDARTIPTQLQYLETLEQKYVQCEDFEKAAKARDKINELKQHQK